MRTRVDAMSSSRRGRGGGATGLVALLIVLLLTGPQLAHESSPGVRLVGFSGVTVDEAVEDIRTAEIVTDRFWSAHWSDHFTGTYRSPEIYGLYDGRDPASAPLCRTAGGSERFGPDNAAYCPDVGGPFIAYDASFMARAFTVGDTFLYLVVAHEWGHAIADQLNQSLQAQAAELQADCLAGAALYGAVADGTLQLEPGDEAEITNGLTSLADETSWTSSQDHGDPFQRITAFNAGRTGGVPACLPS